MHSKSNETSAVHDLLPSPHKLHKLKKNPPTQTVY